MVAVMAKNLPLDDKGWNKHFT